jgi:hypothetical protein
MTWDLETFERHMNRNGAGIAPNGCSYKLTVAWVTTRTEQEPVCERVNPEGIRETICGYNGTTFPSADAARCWAIQDGRREYSPGKSFSERKIIA